jgi:hypothetical protein
MSYLFLDGIVHDGIFHDGIIPDGKNPPVAPLGKGGWGGSLLESF